MQRGPAETPEEEERPVLTLVAGPNGAGKSTLTASLREKEGGLLSKTEVIDPDQIARELKPGHPEGAAFEAGKEAIRRQRQFLDERKSFALETTLSGSRGLRLLHEAKRRGYETRLVYVGVESSDQSVRRVEQRAREGGHDVPEGDVRRRYHRSLVQLPKAVAEADRALVYDNSDLGERARPLLEVRAGRVEFAAGRKPSWLGEAFAQEQASLAPGEVLGKSSARSGGSEHGGPERKGPERKGPERGGRGL